MMIMIFVTGWIVNYAVYFGDPSYFSCHAAGFFAEVYELCSIVISTSSIFIHEYMISNMIMVPYYLG